MKMFLHSSVLSLLGFSLAVLPVCTASAIPENFSYSSAVKQNYEYSRYAALDDYLVVTMTEPGTLKDQITDEMVDGVTRLRIVGLPHIQVQEPCGIGFEPGDNNR